jgi:hypothetical protein
VLTRQQEVCFSVANQKKYQRGSGGVAWLPEKAAGLPCPLLRHLWGALILCPKALLMCLQQEMYASIPEDVPLYNLPDVVPEIYEPK